MYYRAAQSWIVYHTFKGENISYKEGLSRARKNLLDIFLLSSLELVFGAISRKLKSGSQQSGGLWSLLNLLLIIAGAAVEEGWDLMGNYLLPGSIIPEKNLGEAISNIKDIKENVPGALVGVFGIDFVGNAVKGYMTFMVIIGVLLSMVAFFITENVLLIYVIYMLVLLAIIASFFGRIVIDMVKTIYFTIFYAVLTASDEIPDDLMEEATHYLNKEHLEHN